MRSGLVVILLCVAFATAGARGQAFAQDSVERFNRQLSQLRETQAGDAQQSEPLPDRVLFDYGGYVAPSYLSIQDQTNQTHVLRELDVVGYASLNLDGAHELYVRGLGIRQDFGRGDSFTGHGDKTLVTLDRAFYRFDLQRALAVYNGKQIDQDVVFQGGRQLITWANGLVLNQIIDGAQLGVTDGPVDLTGIAGLTDVRDVDFDSSRPGFDAHTRRLFYGGMLALNLGEQRPFIYALEQDDNNGNTTLREGALTTRYLYDSHYLAAGSAGNLSDKLSYASELVYEGGRGLSNSFVIVDGMIAPVAQKLEPIEAYAADTRFDYSFTDLHRTRASMEITLATGDKDRTQSTNTFGGNQRGTSDHGFNAFGLIDTGLAFNPAVSNVMIGRLGGTTFPFAGNEFLNQLQVGVDLFIYGTLTNGAPIDEPTNRSGQFLGGEPDAFLNWQLASDVTLAMRYGCFFPDRSQFSFANPRQFFYTGITFAF